MNFLNFKNQISREKMKSLLGGEFHSLTLDGNPTGACTASCPDGTLRTCTDNGCKAEDNVGCSSPTESNPC